MKLRWWLLIAFTFMMFSLVGQHVVNIDLTKAKHVKVEINKLYDRIEYVPLELSPKALIKIKSAS